MLCTVLMAAIHFLLAVVIVRIFVPAIVFGEGLCAFLCSYLLSGILAMCEEKDRSDREVFLPYPIE